METRAGYAVRGCDGEASPDDHDHEQQQEAAASQPAANEWYTQVANTFMNAACSRFDLAATRCFLYIIRHSVGFHQSEIALAHDEFCFGRLRKDGTRHDDGTQLSRRAVIIGLQQLAEAHVITIEGQRRGRGHVSTYAIAPVNTWRLDDEHLKCANSAHFDIESKKGADTAPISPDKCATDAPIRPIKCANSAPPINKEKKEKREKESADSADASSVSASPDGAEVASASSSQNVSMPVETPPTTKRKKTGRAALAFAPDSAPMQHAILLRDGILRNFPKAKEANAACTQQDKLEAWAEEMEKLERLDKRTPEEIRATIEFAVNDSFWKSNLLSGLKFREKFDKLDAKRLAIEAAKARQPRNTYPPRATPAEPPQYASPKDHALWK